MAKFTTRVELHNATDEDYEQLHEEMEKRGFSRTIEAGGTIYQLPTAEYNLIGQLEKDDVLKKAKDAADAVQKKYKIIVTKSAGRVVSGLDEV